MVTNMSEPKTITDDMLSMLKLAAKATKRNKEYARRLDDWELINGAWPAVDKYHKEGDSIGFIFYACYKAMSSYLIKKYKFGTLSFNASLAFLSTNIGGLGTATNRREAEVVDRLPNRSYIDKRFNDYANTDHVNKLLADTELSDRERAVIHLRYYEKLQFNEIAEALGLASAGCASVPCAMAIKKIRKQAGLNDIF